MEISDWLTIVGWLATFGLGIGATLIAQRVAASRKRIGWTLVNESNLLSEAALREIESGFGVPLQITIGGARVSDLSTIRIKLGNIGNVELKNLTLHFQFGKSAKVYVGRYIGDLGVYRKKLSLQKKDNVATIEIAHINKSQSFEVEFLVGHYRAGDLAVDMAEPGVQLKQVTAVRLEVGLGRFRYFSLGMFGVRYDPTATQTAYLVDEVRNLRQLLAAKLADDIERGGMSDQ